MSSIGKIDNKENFYQTHENFKLQKESLLRKIKVIFLRIVGDFWRSFGSFFCKVEINAELEKIIKQKKDGFVLDGAIVRQFTHKKAIGPFAVNEVLSKLEESTCLYIANFMMGTSTTLPDLPYNMNFLFVPVVLEGGIRDHIVAVVYDKTNNRIELYDSKGLTAKDRKEFIYKTDLRLEDLMIMIAQKYGNEATTCWENQEKHQRDCHNCGIYVLDYFQRRFQEMTPEEISNNGLTFEQANEAKRLEYLNLIVGD